MSVLLLYLLYNFFIVTAVEKAILYLEKDELPTHWDKALFLNLELPSADEDSQDSDLDVSHYFHAVFTFSCFLKGKKFFNPLTL